MNLTEWAARWRIPAGAITELRQAVLGLDNFTPPDLQGLSEAAVQARVRLAATRRGWRVWRNNVGAMQDPDTGSFVRFGLANDTPQLNKVLKSSDLIGIAPRIIQPDDVGHVFGQFVSFEVKHGSWSYSGTEHEVAQLNWLNLVQSLGGEARFVASETTL